MNVRRGLTLALVSLGVGLAGCAQPSTRFSNGMQSRLTTAPWPRANPTATPSVSELKPPTTLEQPRPSDGDDSDDSHPSRWPKKLRAKYADCFNPRSNLCGGASFVATA